MSICLMAVRLRQFAYYDCSPNASLLNDCYPNDSLPTVPPPLRVREGITCPAGLGRGKHSLGGWLDQGRLEINAPLVKG